MIFQIYISFKQFLLIIKNQINVARKETIDDTKIKSNTFLPKFVFVPIKIIFRRNHDRFQPCPKRHP